MKKIVLNANRPGFDDGRYLDYLRIELMNVSPFKEEKLRHFAIRKFSDQRSEFKGTLEGPINGAVVSVRFQRNNNAPVAVHASYDITGDSGFSWWLLIISLVFWPLIILFIYKVTKGNLDVEFERQLRASFGKALEASIVGSSLPSHFTEQLQPSGIGSAAVVLPVIETGCTTMGPNSLEDDGQTVPRSKFSLSSLFRLPS